MTSTHDPLIILNPALQEHAAADVLPKAACELAGQSTHTYADSTAPAGASGSSSSRRRVLTHGPPACPVKPALQVHALSDVLPNGECEFGGQASHAAGTKPFFMHSSCDAHWSQHLSHAPSLKQYSLLLPVVPVGLKSLA